MKRILDNIKAGIIIIPIAFLIMLISDKCSAQDTIITYTEIKQFDSLTKDQIFDRIKLWSVEAFKRTKGSMQVDDRVAGLLAYDASVEEISPNAPEIKDKKDAWKLIPFVHNYTCKIKIQVKENKYKIEIYDIKLVELSDQYPLTSAIKAPYRYTFSKQSKLDTNWADEKLTFAEFSKVLFASLESAVKKSDDW